MIGYVAYGIALMVAIVWLARLLRPLEDASAVIPLRDDPRADPEREW
jgi:hypothetical protein